MSEKNRKIMYETLKENGEEGKRPDLSQDDGALEREFGTPETEQSKKKREAKAKEATEKLLKEEIKKNKGNK